MRAINWFGIVGGIVAVILIALSLHTPWWQLIIGDVFLKVNVSPFSHNLSFLEIAFMIPLILALNFSSLLMLLIGGIILILYSLNPSKAYSKRLLCFAYKKPLYAVISFLMGIIALHIILSLVFNINIPINGTALVNISDPTRGAIVRVPITTSLNWPFWLAVITAALCVAARIYHKKLAA
ncbi:MAG: hypothetical protein QW424_07090 [Candidatus Bathyarchaeia archaeon]